MYNVTLSTSPHSMTLVVFSKTIMLHTLSNSPELHAFPGFRNRNVDKLAVVDSNPSIGKKNWGGEEGNPSFERQ